MTALKVMLSCFGLFAIVFTVMNLSYKSDEVEILIVDDFSSSDSHGRSMASIADKWSLGRCKVVEFQTGNTTVLDYLLALAKAAKYAAEHREKKFVLNLSLGSERASELEGVIFRLMKSDGLLAVAAAGNDGKNLLIYPAAFEGVVAIAASNDGARASYSNYGHHVTLCVSVIERRVVKERAIGHGRDAITVRSVITKAGTSKATAKFSGIAALIWSTNPHATKSEVLEVATSYCHPMEGWEYESEQLGKGNLDDFRVLFASSATWWRFSVLATESLLLCLCLLFPPDMNKTLPGRVLAACIACAIATIFFIVDVPWMLRWGFLAISPVFLAAMGLVAFSADRVSADPVKSKGLRLTGKRIVLSSGPACERITRKIAGRLGKLGAEVKLSPKEVAALDRGVDLCSHISKSGAMTITGTTQWLVNRWRPMGPESIQVIGGFSPGWRPMAEELAKRAEGTMPFNSHPLDAKANADLRKAEDAPGYVRRHILPKARAAIETGQFAELIRECSLAIESGRLSRIDLVATYRVRALAYGKTGDLDKALADLTSAIELWGGMG